MRYYTVSVELWRGIHDSGEFFTVEPAGKTAEEMREQYPECTMELVPMHEVDNGERVTFTEVQVEVWDEES